MGEVWDNTGIDL